VGEINLPKCFRRERVPLGAVEVFPGIEMVSRECGGDAADDFLVDDVVIQPSIDHGGFMCRREWAAISIDQFVCEFSYAPPE
jgi:hypothetical protein